MFLSFFLNCRELKQVSPTAREGNVWIQILFWKAKCQQIRLEKGDFMFQCAGKWLYVFFNTFWFSQCLVVFCPYHLRYQCFVTAPQVLSTHTSYTFWPQAQMCKCLIYLQCKVAVSLSDDFNKWCNVAYFPKERKCQDKWRSRLSGRFLSAQPLSPYDSCWPWP